MANSVQQELVRRLLFVLERLLVRGAHYRLLIVAGLIGLVSLAGGLAVRGSGDATLDSEIWWAFLRLSDPGYLGDDVGTWRRVVSTVLTILGYVIFLGAMVAILTQWLNGTLERLEMGLTPVRMDGHVAILGWTASTRTICTNLVRGERRLNRWLELQGVRRLRIAVLASNVGPARVQELKDALGPDYHRNQIVLRSGSPLRGSHLERVDVQNAACVVVPGVEGTSRGAEDYDAVVLKILRMMSANETDPNELPTCVCEILDPRRIPLAHRAYRGALQVVASDVLVGRLLGESLRYPGVAGICLELLTRGEGATLRILDWADGDTTFDEVQRRFPQVAIVGIVRAEDYRHCIVAPPRTTIVRRDDFLAAVARGSADIIALPTAVAAPSADDVVLEAAPAVDRRLLVLGWSRRVVDLLEELLERPAERWRVDLLSTVEITQRATLPPAIEACVNHLVGDPTIPGTLAEQQPHTYDRIVLVAADWVASGEEADARTITTYLGLEEVIPEGTRWPAVVAELFSRPTGLVFDEARVEIVDGPRMVAHAMAQFVLRREMHAVIDAIFGTGDSEVAFVHLRGTVPVRYAKARAAVRKRGAEALGVRRGGLGGPVELIPGDETLVEPGDELVLVERTSIKPLQ